MARTDDVINVAGHRPSTGQLEEVLADHPDIAECAVIGVADQLKGQLPLGFICLYPNGNRAAEDIIPEAIALVKDRVGRVSALILWSRLIVCQNPIGKSVARHNGQNRRWGRMVDACDH